MTPAETPAPLDIGRVLARLASLAEQHKAAGRVSHALGVRSAMESIKRGAAGARAGAKNS